MPRFKITVEVEAENQLEADAFSETFGDDPGAQWDKPLETRVLAIDEIEEHES